MEFNVSEMKDNIRTGAGKAFESVKTGTGKAFESVKSGTGKAFDSVKSGAEKVSGTFDNAKGVTIGSKCDFSFRVRNARENSDLVNFGFKFDKEFPLLRVVGVVLGTMALIIALSAVLDNLFGKRGRE